MVWGAVIGAVGSLAAGYLSSQGAKKAAKSQDRAALEGIAEQRRQFDITDAQFAPYRAFGAEGLEGYQNLVDPQNQLAYLQGNPLYDYLNKQVLDSTRDRMIAGGKSYSGQGAKTVQEGVYDLSEGLINNALSRYGGMIDVGQGSVARTAAARENLANNVTNLGLQRGNVQAAGTIGQYNAYADTINELSKMAGNWNFSRKQTNNSTPSASTQLSNYFSKYGYQ